MIDAPSTIWPSPTMALFFFVLGAVIIIALKLVWKKSGLGKPTEHRVGKQMANARATVLEWSDHEGYIDAEGERWRAVSKEPLTEGDRVQITRVDGLRLEVKKA